MKLLLTSLSMIFISFGASAITVGELYKHCKPYQNNGFEFDNLSSIQVQNALACITYLQGMIDRGRATCIIIDEINKRKFIDKNKLNVISSLTANGKAPIDPIITSFNNYAENNTGSWKYAPFSYTGDFISKNYPCKLDE